jgi:hypothetical protein
MTYLHEGLTSEAQHISTSNGSSTRADLSLSAELIPNTEPYCRVVRCFVIELVTGHAKLKLELID